MKKISMSEITEYKDCRRKHYLHHYLGLSKKDKSGALALGTNVHDALEVYYSPGGTKEAAMQRFESIYWKAKTDANEYEIEGVIKDETMGRIMLEGYWDWAEETGVDAHLEIIEAEADIEYQIDVAGVPVTIMGKRDLIARNALTGTAALLDHKTCQTFTDNMIDIVEQPRMYLLLQRLVGSTEVQEVLWNKLRKVKRTARATPPFYQREELYISEEELRRFYLRLIGTIKDILMTEANLRANPGVDANFPGWEESYESCYPRPSSDCSWKCVFRKICPLMDSDPEAAKAMVRDMFEIEDPYDRYLDVKGVV